MSKKSKRLTITQKKFLLIKELRDVRADIIEVSSNIDPAKAEEVFLGNWSLLDLLAHLEGWDHTNKLASEEILRGEVPTFYEEYDKDWASYNAKLVTKYKKSDLIEMLESVNASHKSLMTCLERLTPEEIFRDQGVRRGSYKVIIRRLLKAEKRDEIDHLNQIEEFVQTGEKGSQVGS